MSIELKGGSEIDLPTAVGLPFVRAIVSGYPVRGSNPRNSPVSYPL